MKDVLISLGLVVSVLLIHFAYVDFRFRYRDGIGWFWMLNPAPPLMWLARALVAVAVIFALCLHFIGGTVTFFWILGGLVAAHIIALILLEVLEPR
jgi:hypothetical protein